MSKITFEIDENPEPGEDDEWAKRALDMLAFYGNAADTFSIYIEIGRAHV